MNSEYSVKLFRSQKKWEDWLSKNHEKPGIWLKFAKKKSGMVSVNYNEALDVALCYGWIDSQAKSLDDKFYLQKFTPRGPRSIWSKINTEHITRLINEGKMKPTGLMQVEAAKKDGRWERAYGSQKNLVVPQDFLDELAKNKKAEAFFKTLNKSNVYAVSFMLMDAKKPETRVRRMHKFISMFARGEKLY